MFKMKSAKGPSTKLGTSGFTLIELIMVIVILGILAAIAIPKYIDLSANAKTSSTKAALSSMRAAISMKYAENAANGAPAYPSAATLGDGSLFVGGQVPKEAYTAGAAADDVASSAENPIATFSNAGGWVYNATTGEIRVNVSEATAAGCHSW